MKKLSQAALVGIVLAPLSLASAALVNGDAPGFLSAECGKFADTETAYTKIVSELAVVEPEDFATYTVEGIDIVEESFGAAEDYKASEGGAVIRRGSSRYIRQNTLFSSEKLAFHNFSIVLQFFAVGNLQC